MRIHRFRPFLNAAYIVLVLYLRLFYTEEFLGWNSEEWPKYLFWSMIWVVTPGLCVAGLRHLYSPLRGFISNWMMVFSCGACLPLCIILFFAAGRVSMLPLPLGVNEMPQFGCCSQSLVFPQSRVADLTHWYESKKVGFVDVLTEEMANEYQEIRWALNPSVVQHIGRKSSKGDDFGEASKYHMNVAEKLWNFAFEGNDAESLREEHMRHASG